MTRRNRFPQKRRRKWVRRILTRRMMRRRMKMRRRMTIRRRMTMALVIVESGDEWIVS
jgi:hypothetical protein